MDYFLYFVIYFGGFITGAVCLEQLWYARRRRNHRVEDLKLDLIEPAEKWVPVDKNPWREAIHKKDEKA